MSHPIRLALVDDHELFRDTLAAALIGHGFDVVAQAGDARQGVALVAKTSPDVVLLDLKLPETDGFTAIRQLRARGDEPRIMVLSASDHPRDVGAAWAAGAHGYATKFLSLPTLIEGVREVAAGKRYLAPGLVVGSEAEFALRPLSRREREVFGHIVHGLTSSEIAGKLGISIKTVDTHRERVLKKLDLHSAVQLVRFAAENGLLDA
jgi:DNA-binding NarL/FixJ family response regulator